MKDYQRLTVKNLGKDTQIKDDYSTFDCLKRLAELEDKIENRTLIELPCQKGDQIWYVNDQRHPPRIEDWIVVGFAIIE